MSDIDWTGIISDVVFTFIPGAQLIADIASGKYTYNKPKDQREDDTPVPSDTDRGDADKLANTSDRQLVTYSKQYQVDIRQLIKLREAARVVSDELNKANMISSKARDKIVALIQDQKEHIGGQRESIKKMKQLTFDDIITSDKKIVEKSRELNAIQDKISTLQDVTTLAQNEPNDRTVADISAKYSVPIDTVEGNLYTKEL